MAAILCQTIGELISKGCKALAGPCKHCGTCCDKLGELMCTPFMPYLVVTFFLNTPSVVLAMKSAPNYECSYSLFRWLVVNAAFSTCHMVASFYIVKIIRAPAAINDTGTGGTISATTGLNPTTDEEKGRYGESNFRPITDGSGEQAPGGAYSFQRIKHVLCYDKGMAVYILVFLVWIFWMAIGVSRRLFFDDLDDNNNADCDEMLGYMNTVIACGYVWMSLVGTAFCCSLLCLR